MQNPNPPPSAPGVPSQPQGQYEIVGRIATGGMAEIYLARAEGIPGVSEVVLKRLMPELQADHEFVQMFHDEANIAAKLRHPGIVRIFELGSLDGSLFIAMELLRGANLRDILKRLHKHNQPMPIAEGAMIAMAVLEALDYAHRFTDAQGQPMNVVHRDVSPQNILVTYEGGVKLVDFGVAKAEGRLHQTRAGLIKGKFAYMSPEQVSGGHIDGRSDVFAVGEVFYELLLKRHPFYANSDMEVLRRILDVDPTHPCELDRGFPAELGEILMRAMKKQPGERYPSAGHMYQALASFLKHNPPAPGQTVEGFMHGMFARRIEKEQRAREIGDDDLLVASLVSGDEDTGDLPTNDLSTPIVADTEASTPAIQDTGSLVEVSNPAQRAHDPAEEPRYMAHSGYHSSPRLRFKSDAAATIFDGSAAQAEPEDNPDETRPLTREDLAHLRASAGVGAVEFSGGVSVTTRDGPGVPELLPPPPKPVTGPTGPLPPVIQPPINSQDLTSSAPQPTSDRIGLLFFLAGLTALIAAVGYAGYLYMHRGGVRLRSDPAGAEVFVDGRYTGQTTPGRLRTLSSEGERKVLFRLDGYGDCVRILADGEAPSELSCTLEKQ